ncbi:MAG: DapH/DapD/GlmU-related protein [Bacteroidales bacterium]|nr:DapH/DapD/GlmU-related protein [Bacteroidales bacterium]
MIIVGCGSAGKEILGMLINLNYEHEIIFYDDNLNSDKVVFGKYQVVNDKESLIAHMLIDPKFCIGIGHPRRRKKVFERFLKLGGIPANIIWDNKLFMSSIIESATVIQPGVAISYDVSMGDSCLIHNNTSIGHKVKIGNFVNISPLCSIIGPCIIGDETYIGANSIVLPGVSIGKNVYIKPGKIVNRDISDFETY